MTPNAFGALTRSLACVRQRTELMRIGSDTP